MVTETGYAIVSDDSGHMPGRIVNVLRVADGMAEAKVQGTCNNQIFYARELTPVDDPYAVSRFPRVPHEWRAHCITIDSESAQCADGETRHYPIVRIVCFDATNTWRAEHVLLHDHWQRSIDRCVDAAQRFYGIGNGMTIDFTRDDS